MEMSSEDIIAIYRKRWEIELLFKQLKQNFPLRYFYGESANAYKNSDLGYTYCKPAFNGHTKTHKTLMELFCACCYSKNYANVLCELLYIP